jgi:Tol biopolymer transport system component
MAPEQIEGKEADARADVFAFGAVVYEMATGRKAFSGGSHASLIAAILTADPTPIHALAPTTSPALDRVVRKCLSKDPEARWQTARDLLDELKWILETGGFSAATHRRRTRLAWLAAASVVVAAITVGTISVRSIWGRSDPPDEPAFRFTVGPPGNATFDGPSTYVVLSPDGRTLVFGASSPTGDTALWARSLDSHAVRRILGTDRGMQPFWSPDSRSLGFLLHSAKTMNGVVARPLKRIDPSGGVATNLIDIREAWAATWNGSDVVFMSGPNVSSGLYRGSPGRAPEPVTTLDQSRGETGHWYPHFLPDGRHFLYLARSRQPEHNGIVYVGSIDSRAPVRLFAADSHVEYAWPGFLLYISSLGYLGKLSGGPLVARPFDVTTLRVTGDAVRVAGPVDRTTDFNRGSFSVSQTGVLAFRPLADMSLVWYDRTGKRLQSIGSGMNPSLSIDGQRLAVARVDDETGASNIWLMDISGGNASRLTSGESVYDMPLWSPDGTRVLFRADRGKGPGIHQKASDGSGSEEVLLAPAEPADSTIMPLAWTEDGRSLVYGKYGSTTSHDLALLPMTGDRKPVTLFEQPSGEFMGTTSPDGRWIAYVTGDVKRTEVFVRPFPSGEGRWKVSSEGGSEPAWRRDGKELFYLGGDGSLMAVAVNSGSAFHAGAPRLLFQTKLTTRTTLRVNRNQYVVSTDGQRFLIREAPDGWNDWKLMPIRIVVNWPAALKK